MRVGICLLGYGSVGKEVYRQLTEDPRYGTDIWIHTIQVTDPSKHGVKISENGGWVLDNHHLTNVSNDAEWLLKSAGHNVVVDTTSYSDDSKHLILKLLSKGHWLYTCSKELAWNDWEALIDCAVDSGARIDFNSIPSSDTPTEYAGIDLNQSNWKDYVNDPDMFIFRGGGPKETAKAIVEQLYKELEARTGA